jgi:hypothetical protein
MLRQLSEDRWERRFYYRGVLTLKRYDDYEYAKELEDAYQEDRKEAQAIRDKIVAMNREECNEFNEQFMEDVDSYLSNLVDEKVEDGTYGVLAHQPQEIQA